MVTLPKPQSGTKRPKLTTPKTTLSPWCYLPNHKSFGYSEVLIWFSDGTILGVVISKCEIPTTNISQEDGHGLLMIECQFVAYN